MRSDEVVGRLANGAHPLLERTRDVQRPGRLSAEAPQLTEDRRDGEGGEGKAARGIEAPDGLDQPYEGHLLEVLERDVRPGVAPSEASRERAVTEDERLEVARMVAGVEAAQQALGRLVPERA